MWLLYFPDQVRIEGKAVHKLTTKYMNWQAELCLFQQVKKLPSHGVRYNF